MEILYNKLFYFCDTIFETIKQVYIYIQVFHEIFNLNFLKNEILNKKIFLIFQFNFHIE